MELEDWPYLQLASLFCGLKRAHHIQKNWRPQIMILAKLDSKLNVKYKRMFSLASQLKAGKGLTIGVTVIEGTFDKMYGESQAARLSIRQGIQEEGLKGFPDVVVLTN